MTCPTCNDSEKIRVPVWVDGLADFSTRTCPTCRRAGPGFWTKGHVLRAAHQPMIMWDGDMRAAPMLIPYFPDQKWWSNRAAELAAIAESLPEEVPLFVARWTDYDEGDSLRGGYSDDHFQALVDEVMRLGLREGGDWHQHDEAGIPVFSDGTAMILGMRSWGGVLADIWGPVDARKYNYMDFYMTCLVPTPPYFIDEAVVAWWQNP